LVKLTEEQVNEFIKKAYIPGISLVVVENNSVTLDMCAGVKNQVTKEPVTNETIFEAASLSKPVFAYLVLKLIEKGVFKELTENFFEYELYKTLPEYRPFFSDESSPTIRLIDSEAGKAINPKMILSHQTGMPNWIGPDKPFKLNEKAGEFVYSGEAYHYLQQVIEKITGKSLQVLCDEYIFSKAALDMPHSSFSKPAVTTNLASGHDLTMVPQLNSGKPDANAGASLHTTAADYTKFLLALMNESDPIYQNMILPLVHVASSADLNNSLDWGMGLGLQVQDENFEKKAIAFHWGDAPNFKAFTAIDIANRSAVVYFSNSENGMAIARSVSELTVGNLNSAMDYLSQHYGYDSIESPGWKEWHEALENAQMAEINQNYSLAMEELQKVLTLRPNLTPIVHYLEWINDLTQAQDQLVLDDRLAGVYGPLSFNIQQGKLKLQVNGNERDLLQVDALTFLDPIDKVKLRFCCSDSDEIVLEYKFHDGRSGQFFQSPIPRQNMIVSPQSLFAKPKKMHEKMLASEPTDKIKPPTPGSHGANE